MENFTPYASAIGGALIGLSAGLLLLLNGRIAGISGIFAGAIGAGDAGDPDRTKLSFVAGLLAASVALVLVMPDAFAITVDRSVGALVVAGLLVGFGTRLGSGCTSGHGVCGLARFSTRSLVATLSFMGAGAATVFAVNHWLGGAL